MNLNGKCRLFHSGISLWFDISPPSPLTHNPLPFQTFFVVLPALFSLVNTIAQAVSCCRHFVADHGAESLLPSNCHSVHFMVHIPCSPFVRVPLAPVLISLTPSLTNNNKLNAHLFHDTVTALLPLPGFQLMLRHVLYVELSWVDNMLLRLYFCAAVLLSKSRLLYVAFSTSAFLFGACEP